MVVSTDEKVHIVTRRFFDADLRRHFVGVVEEANEVTMRVRGYAFIYDQASGQFTRRVKERALLLRLSKKPKPAILRPGSN